jgi:DNA (cytosine-5)-methyltransferase 1
MTQPTFLVIDLFCGFGGTTLGFSRAQIQDEPVAKVLACVNHDPKAINSHLLNHPEVHHFTEDIRTLELSPLMELVRKARIQYPDAYVVLWASLECTNHSKAKGGLPRDADSRTLACDLFRYQEALQPDYIMIENVVEFMAWGPLDENGKPVSRKNGQDWIRWRNQMNALGYWDDWRELNSANYGSYTSRNRLFGAFARPGLPIVWPEATHSKKVRPGMFGSLKPWKAVKDVLDFSDEGKSIFDRKKPLVEKTLERIYAGLIKYVAGGQDAFMQHVYACSSNGANNHGLDQPGRTVTTRDARALVQVGFISKYYSGKPEGKNIPLDGPAGTITCADGQALVQTHFLYKYYGNGHNLQSVEDPAGTITVKDRFVSVGARFIDRQFTGSKTPQSVDEPSGTILINPKSSLVTTFLVNRQFNNIGSSTEDPAPTLIATQNKRPLYLVRLETGEFGIEVYSTDSPMTRKIKEFMALYGIADIRMRMLKVPELLRIQGFPDTYQMVGTQEDHKKYIGNSVEPNVVKAWVEALAGKINVQLLKQA